MAHKKTTSKKIASKASKLLRSNKTSASVKSVSGSALSQKHGSGHNRKRVAVATKPRKR